ncbi:MAG: hypothetical protein GXO49_05165 [Chlorobi bacterium]|nr:hypothetical protein [Chlorobiota bacterium]
MGLYIIDNALLSDVYDYIIGFSDLSVSTKKGLKLAFPLVVLLIYTFGIDGHSKARRKYEDTIDAYQAKYNSMIELEQPPKPISLYVTAFLKYVFPMFIILVAAATYMAQGGTVNLLLSSAMYWIALVSHLMVIFFGEAGLKSIKVAIAKMQHRSFWKKRRKLENEKIKITNDISNQTEEWYTPRELALNGFPDTPREQLEQIFRPRFRNDEKSVLQRITAINFSVSPDKDKPLFPCWDNCSDDESSKNEDVNYETSQQDNEPVIVNNERDDNSDEDIFQEDENDGFDTNINDEEKFV